ncbi:MAG: phosphate/phosphite/phosphonate ABC transporter substrate-binding protein [Firmicutes bacterium]|nr:phosphate/phosphite/phosphonate ABC transporter substrate-binding protein [Bacillota bacterium]MCL5038532.1 phosphate/phosphite/phosphonate ABC transporter substrate-binding protein [Bacillota bacterium]
MAQKHSQGFRFPLLLLVITFLLTGCLSRGPEVVNLRNLSPNYPGAAKQEVASQKDKVLRVAAAPVISPRENFQYYGDLLKYLAETTGYSVSLIQRPTYAEINNLMKAGEVDVAFVCTYSYIQGHDDFGMELLAAPEVGGAAEYRSYLIVPAQSQVRQLADLKGKSFAFTDILSTSGWLVPVFRLKEMGTTPEAFFRSTEFTYSHDNSIRAVAEGLVDGAMVDSIVFDTMVAQDPALGRKVKVVARSEAFASPPVVVNPLLAPELKGALKKYFLDLMDTERGRAILKRLEIDRFVPITDDKYNLVREMAKRVGER